MKIPTQDIAASKVPLQKLIPIQAMVSPFLSKPFLFLRDWIGGLSYQFWPPIVRFKLIFGSSNISIFLPKLITILLIIWPLLSFSGSRAGSKWQWHWPISSGPKLHSRCPRSQVTSRNLLLLFNHSKEQWWSLIGIRHHYISLDLTSWSCVAFIDATKTTERPFFLALLIGTTSTNEWTPKPEKSRLVKS